MITFMYINRSFFVTLTNVTILPDVQTSCYISNLQYSREKLYNWKELFFQEGSTIKNRLCMIEKSLIQRKKSRYSLDLGQLGSIQVK